MRPERITLKNAQKVWDAIADNCLVFANKKLPQIDMAEIFAGRKSMDYKDVQQAVIERVGRVVPLE
jgi:hypothetical protein